MEVRLVVGVFRVPCSCITRKPETAATPSLDFSDSKRIQSASREKVCGRLESHRIASHRKLKGWNRTIDTVNACVNSRSAPSSAPRPHRETYFGTMDAIHPTSTFRRGVPAGSTLGAEEIEMPSGSRATPTATLLAKSKKTAKTLAKTTDLTHAQALERVAEDAGYSSWHELLHACDSANQPQRAKDDMPVDPELPPDFDNTPNEERSTEELDTWWDRPFAQARADGTLDVRCLDGGAGTERLSMARPRP
jgi:hypothetical protein